MTTNKRNPEHERIVKRSVREMENNQAPGQGLKKNPSYQPAKINPRIGSMGNPKVGLNIFQKPKDR
ncbi:MAG: hypothetical protein D6710_08270 [Nitrospirae bacterium]|nr:MAG: hypothetical protein D6710_08270 [Nitrospirota bacterium]